MGRCSVLAAAIGVIALTASSARAETEVDPTTRGSEQIEDKYLQWSSPGFRVQLITGYSFFAGGPSVATAHSFDLAVHAGWRLNPRWGLMAAFRYSFFLEGLSGARWTATLEPVLYLENGFSFSAGVGYGGIWGSVAQNRFYDYEAALEDPARIDLNRGTDEPVIAPFVNCSGDGIVAVARMGYRFTVGEMFSTGPVLEINGQWTVCSDQEFDQRIPEDADIPAPQQWWSYFTAGLSWVFAWR